MSLIHWNIGHILVWPHSLIVLVGTLNWEIFIRGNNMHSQKQSVNWAADLTAQMVPCWLCSSLKYDFWPVLKPRQLQLNIRVFPEFNQPTHLNINRKLTETLIYSGVSYFFWESAVNQYCRLIHSIIEIRMWTFLEIHSVFQWSFHVWAWISKWA